MKRVVQSLNNGQSRIYVGIHWAFDKTEGIRPGRRIADFVFANAFQISVDACHVD